MLWAASTDERLASAAAIRPLLERALAGDPSNGLLHAKLGFLHLDRYDFTAAAHHIEAAISLGSAPEGAVCCLARCYNMLGRPRDALRLLADCDTPQYERGLALLALGEAAEAEREFRAILDADPLHHHACRKLCRLLRKSGRTEEMLCVCEELAARGAAHSQLFYNWGWALALEGEIGKARRLLIEPERIATAEFPPPDGFATIEAFNCALAEEILTNPNIVGDFPREEEANRGSKRVDNLYSGARPALIDLLLNRLQRIAGAHVQPARAGFDPWPNARPATARLKAWGLIQRGGDYETWHIHRGGWLSGVYYVRVPQSVTGEGAGPGCIEFGPPPGLARSMPGAASIRRLVPREGMLLLAPSHYPHRTIASGVAEDRISIAFDVVPVR